jgi:tetratricopeptide (TPR) repeat protein
MIQPPMNQQMTRSFIRFIGDAIVLAASAALLLSCALRDPYRQGNLALEQRDYNHAILWYEQVLVAHPDDLRARNNLGVAYLRADNTDLAFQEFQKILALHPDDAKAHFNLALVYYKQGLYDRELEEYRKTIELDPDHFEAHVHLGHADLAKGLDADAIREYEWVLKRDPNQLQVLYNLSLLYEDQGRLREALSLLDRYLTLENGNPANPQSPKNQWSSKAAQRADALRKRLSIQP